MLKWLLSSPDVVPDCAFIVKGLHIKSPINHSFFIVLLEKYLFYKVRESCSFQGWKIVHVAVNLYKKRGASLFWKASLKIVWKNKPKNILTYADKENGVCIKNKYEPFKWRYYDESLKEILSVNEIKDDGNSTFYLLITEIK